MRYGIPYHGSKNSIAREIVRFLPAAGTLIDICAGGWAARQRVPVFISSYRIDDPRFVCVWEREKRCLFQRGSGALRTERIYTQRGASA